MKQGSVLVEMDMDGYRPLGAFGQPVHKSFVQLQAAVRQRLGARCADLFARPQWDERSRKIRWVAPVPGEAKNWNELDPAEQAERALDLQIIRAEFENYLGELRSAGASSGGKSGGEAFASVLEQALKTPNDGHLHFVGEQPVMTFWGFSELSGARFDPLAAAPPVAAAAAAVPPVTPAAPPPQEEPHRRFPAWLLWLIPLLLLLLLFLLWWFFWEGDRQVETPGGQRLGDPTEPVTPRQGGLEIPPQEPVPDTVPDALPDVVPEPERAELLPGERAEPVIRDRQGRVYRVRRLSVDEQGRVVDENGRVVEGITVDQLRDLQEGKMIDRDGDGVPDKVQVDLDGDGVLDGELVDRDGDGIADGVAIDRDGDGVPEGEFVDRDGDGLPDGIVDGDGALGDNTNPPVPGGTPDTATPEDAQPGEALDLPEDVVRQSEETPPVPEGQQGQTDPQTGEPDSTSPVPEARPGQTAPVPVEFMRGKWRSRSKLTDEQGNQLDQTYEFDQSGKGQSVIRRADGTRCTAPAEARMEGGKLRIQELENLKCADGQQFEKSETTCERDANGQTRCKGQGFDVQIERPE